MQLMKFVTRDTKDKNKILVWCTTNRLITFRDFMQYVLDNSKNPKDFMIIDTEKDLVYDMYKVATEIKFTVDKDNNVKADENSKVTKTEDGTFMNGHGVEYGLVIYGAGDCITVCLETIYSKHVRTIEVEAV